MATMTLERWNYVEPKLTKLADKFKARSAKAKDLADTAGAVYEAVREDDDMPGVVATDIRLEGHKAEERATKYGTLAGELAVRASKGANVENYRAGWKLDELDKLDAKLRGGKLTTREYRKLAGVLYASKNVDEYIGLVEADVTPVAAK